jgi:copper(I)-binding protein
MIREFAVAFAAAFLLAGCSREAEAPSVEVKAAWLRLPAVPGGAAAGYFEAEANRSGQILVAAAIPGARVEMHESMTANHMTTMQPLATAPFAGKRLSFAPGGKHLMVFGLAGDATPGTTVPLTLRFKSAPPVTVAAKLVAAGQSAPGDDG